MRHEVSPNTTTPYPEPSRGDQLPDTIFFASHDACAAVERMHGGSATLARSVPVRETFRRRPFWEGVVHIFDLKGHPTATRAYAWSWLIKGHNTRRFFAVLHMGRIKSPVDAVRAAILAEHRNMEVRYE
jgi:hypothetical protein